ncbi:MAG: CHAP domain-containing protein, partial [Candidatus Nanoarchaeia archaeon]|nr:CHAP domain-containing protein [Candidatus Nanoarchaeia archaeon]
ISTLKEIFWQMNEIQIALNDEMVNEESTDENGNIKINEVQKKILHIDITSKTVEEMADIYNFNSYQRKQLNELLNDKYSKLWSSVIYGNLVGNSDIVSTANSQLGNIGGEIYWRWYGFNSRVEWCAIFVSWVAEQTGYIESGILPKFSSCNNGVQWFKMLNLWKDNAYIPKSGDIIFFDWEQDNIVDHVGIVEKVENNEIFTIEGNSLDECRRNEYDLNSKVIFGYGTPSY